MEETIKKTSGTFPMVRVHCIPELCRLPPLATVQVPPTHTRQHHHMCRHLPMEVQLRRLEPHRLTQRLHSMTEMLDDQRLRHIHLRRLLCISLHLHTPPQVLNTPPLHRRSPRHHLDTVLSRLPSVRRHRVTLLPVHLSVLLPRVVSILYHFLEFKLLTYLSVDSPSKLSLFHYIIITNHLLLPPIQSYSL